jgi:hypothetical protein
MESNMSDELKSIEVEIEGFGVFEIREPLFEDVEAMFDSAEGASKTFGLNLLKKCVYQNGELVWNKPVGAAKGIKLMALAPQVMQLIGFGEQGKPSELES